MDCRAVRDGDLVEGYLLGRLAEAERDAFEAHFFECEDCFARLEAARLLRQELRASGARAVPLHPPTRTWTWLATAAGLAAVAVGVSVLTLRREGFEEAPAASVPVPEALPSPVPAPPAAPPATIAPAAPAMSPPATPLPMPSPVPLATPSPQSDPRRVAPPSLRDLGRFDLPPYVPGSPSPASEPSEADRLFQRAMADYANGDCRAALPDLRRAAALDPARAEFTFFLGICRLLSDDIDAGINRLEKVLALGPGPHRDAAAFHLAKGFLLKEDRAAAQGHLRDLAVRPGPFQDPARALLARMDAVR